jgi:exopolysaccharide biosynthesis polyprenyl glycosylphosphotransferase
VLITSEEDKHKLAKTFAEHPEFGFRVVLHITSFNDVARSRIRELNSRDEVDDILLANPQVTEATIGELANFTIEEQIGFRYTADLLPVPLTHFELNTLAGVPMIEIKRTSLEGWGRVWKRIFDVVVASLMLIITSPIFLITALFIKATSRGPVLKDLQRVGDRGKIFTLYKFRSMVENAESLKEQLLQFNERKDGPLFKMKNDPRVTPFGRFIRKTSIDELPQLLNVLQGTMSLVGPRPHEPQEVARYSQNQKKLLSIKPGMTGMAQVSGRSDLQFEEEALLDIYYIENWNLLFDIRLMLKTFQVVLLRKGSA